MITQEDIDNLAELSRLELSAEEKVLYKNEINSILEYIGKLEEVKFDKTNFAFKENVNTMREDIVTTPTGSHTRDLLGVAPDSKNDYVKVKKIL